MRSFSDCLALQANIDTLIVFCTDNTLQLNVAKCKRITLTRNERCIEYLYNINAAYLDYYPEISDLGIILDKGLTFVAYVQHICNVAMRLLDLPFRSFKYVNKGFLYRTLFFFSLIKSRIEY